jgi:hypothetical protein
MKRRGFAVKYPNDPAIKGIDLYLAGPAPRAKYDPADAALFDTAEDAAKYAEAFPIPPGTDGKGHLSATVVSLEFIPTTRVEVRNV